MKIKLPHSDIPIEFIVGGACRDTLCENENVKPKDYDLFYTDKDMYLKALKIMSDCKAKCLSVESGDWGDYRYTMCKFKVIGYNQEETLYDILLFNCNRDELINFIKITMDFNFNTCYQYKNEDIIVSDVAIRDIKNGVISINNNADFEMMSLSDIVRRAMKFQDRGYWEIDESVVSFIVNRLGDVFQNPRGYINRENWLLDIGAYGVNGVDKNPIRRIMKIIPDEKLILGFLSDSDNVVKAFRKEYNKRNRISIFDRLFRRNK